jgi:hypothetical protein
MYPPRRISEKQEAVLWILDHIEETELPDAEFSYERILRGLGAWLDDHAARCLTLVETEVRFIVLFDPGTGDSEREPVELTAAHMRSYESGLKARVGRPGGRYQDLLRGVGHELDDLGASALLIDEIEDSFLVSYLYRSAHSRLMWEKKFTVLSKSDQAALLAKSRNRRKPEPRRRWRVRRHPN